MIRPPISFALAAILTATGCAGSDTSFPSLAPRPVEAAVADPDAPAVAAQIGDVDPAMANQIRAILATARAGDSAFSSARRIAEPIVARAQGSAPGSEAWLSAQQAITVLDAARANTQDAQTSLDDLATGQAQAGAAPSYAADRAAITLAIDEIAALLAVQTATFDALNARLRQP